LAETRITIRNNGSLRVEGDFTLLDQDGNAFDLAGRTVVALCRCGHSQNKPFCDGSHKQCGFESQVKAFALPPAPLPATPKSPL
jgi:CDGSH-type Zn-finger protein